MKNIELPHRVVVGDGAIEKVPDVVKELGLRGNALIVCDKNTRKIAGEKMARLLGGTIAEHESTEQIIREASMKEASYLAAVGGGTIIDAR